MIISLGYSADDSNNNERMEVNILSNDIISKYKPKVRFDISEMCYIDLYGHEYNS